MDIMYSIRIVLTITNLYQQPALKRFEGHGVHAWHVLKLGACRLKVMDDTTFQTAPEARL